MCMCIYRRHTVCFGHKIILLHNITNAFLSFILEHAKSVHYSNLERQIIDEDIVKAIKCKLNNEEKAWKKQNELTKE